MPVIQLAIPTLVMVALLMIPGGLLAWALGLRGHVALGLAGPASVALIATAGAATGYLPISWGLLPVVVVTIVGVLIGLAMRLLVARLPGAKGSWRGQWTGRNEWLTYLGIALAAGLIAFAFLRALDRADSFAALYDNFFHMSVIRFYVESGQASPYVPYDFGDPAGRSFIYPTAWHQIASLLVVTGVTESVPLAQNTLILGTAALVWPTSLFFWVRSVFKSGPALLIGTGVLAAAFAAFPFFPMGYGPLYPFMLGVSMLPFGLGLSMQALGLGEGERLHWGLLAVLGLIYAGATLIAHPNGLLGWIAISTALLVALAVRQFVRASSGAVTWASARRTALIALALTAVAAIIWLRLRPGPHHWPPTHTIAQAFGEFWLAAPLGRPAGVAVFILVAIGLLFVARRLSYSYLLAQTGIVLLLWLAVASFGNLELRHLLTGGFYNDLARLGMLIPLGLLPLALLGPRVADEWFANSPPRARWRTRLALLVVGTVALTYATQAQGNVREEVWRIADAHRTTADSRELSADELTMLTELPEFVSPDDVVFADTRTGASFMYPLEGLHPTQFHPKEGLSGAEHVLLAYLSDPEQVGRVCDAVHESSADFVLDFGTDQIDMDLWHTPPVGLMHLDDSELLTLVHQVGQTRLYAITGCD